MSENFEIREHVLVRYRGLEPEITVPQEVTEIGEGAFSNCHFAEKICLHDGITKIGNHAFGGCRALREVKIPDSVTELGEYTFQYCDRLNRVKFSENLKQIRDGVFRHCTALETLEFPKSTQSVGYETLYGCDHLKRIILYGEKFGRSMLDGCFALNFFDGPYEALIRLEQDTADVVSLEFARNYSAGVYSEVAEQAYARYLTDVSEGIIRYIAENDDVKALSYFVEHNAISEQSTDRFISSAQKCDAFRVLSTLMEYHNRRFGGAGMDFIDRTFSL